MRSHATKLSMVKVSGRVEPEPSSDPELAVAVGVAASSTLVGVGVATGEAGVAAAVATGAADDWGAADEAGAADAEGAGAEPEPLERLATPLWGARISTVMGMT